MEAAEVRVTAGEGPALERREQALPGLVETALGGVENGKDTPWLRHLGMSAAEPIEDFDGFAHPSLVRAQEAVQPSGPGMSGIALEQRVERLARLRMPLFRRERDRTLQGFIERRGHGRADHRQQAEHEHSFLHRCIEPLDRPPGNRTEWRWEPGRGRPPTGSNAPPVATRRFAAGVPPRLRSGRRAVRGTSGTTFKILILFFEINKLCIFRNVSFERVRSPTRPSGSTVTAVREEAGALRSRRWENGKPTEVPRHDRLDVPHETTLPVIEPALRVEGASIGNHRAADRE